MKKLFSVLFVLCLLTGCASTASVKQVNSRLDENVKRIDQNFVVIGKALKQFDERLRKTEAIPSELAAGYEEGKKEAEKESTEKAAIAEAKRNPNSGSAIGVLGDNIAEKK